MFNRLEGTNVPYRCLVETDCASGSFWKVSNFAQTSAADRETVAAGGAHLVERSMTKADEFREYAEEALQWSRKSKY